jgi:hypothetical protein
MTSRKRRPGSRGVVATAWIASSALAVIGTIVQAQSDSLLTGRSMMSRRGTSARYDGIGTAERGPSPRLADFADDIFGQGPVETSEAIYFRSAQVVGIGLDDGLAKWHKATSTWRRFGMHALARAANWYAPGEKNEVSEDIYGLAGHGDRLWMGTNGLGIVMLNLLTGEWSRFDVKETPAPGSYIVFVYYADAKYVFASGAPPARVDGGPALDVYSLAHDAWSRVLAVPRTSVEKFATNRGLMVEMGCDQESYATELYLPLAECGGFHPDRVVAIDSGPAYRFERHYPAPGSSGSYTITAAQLEAAFARFSRTP